LLCVCTIASTIGNTVKGYTFQQLKMSEYMVKPTLISGFQSEVQSQIEH